MTTIIFADGDSNLPDSFTSNDIGGFMSAHREFYARIIHHLKPPHGDTRTPARCVVLTFGNTDAHIEIPPEINLFGARNIILTNHTDFADMDLMMSYAEKLFESIPRSTSTRLLLPVYFKGLWDDVSTGLPSWHKYEFIDLTLSEALVALAIDLE